MFASALYSLDTNFIFAFCAAHDPFKVLIRLDSFLSVGLDFFVNGEKTHDLDHFLAINFSFRS
jgi:hypothetical protein